MKNELQQLFCYLQFDTVECKPLVCTSVAKHCRLLYANILVYCSIILSAVRQLFWNFYTVLISCNSYLHSLHFNSVKRMFLCVDGRTLCILKTSKTQIDAEVSSLRVSSTSCTALKQIL